MTGKLPANENPPVLPAPRDLQERVTSTLNYQPKHYQELITFYYISSAQKMKGVQICLEQ